MMTALYWVLVPLLFVFATTTVVFTFGEKSFGAGLVRTFTAWRSILLGTIAAMIPFAGEILLGAIGAPELLVGLIGWISLRGTVDISPWFFLGVVALLSIMAFVTDPLRRAEG